MKTKNAKFIVSKYFTQLRGNIVKWLKHGFWNWNTSLISGSTTVLAELLW